MRIVWIPLALLFGIGLSGAAWAASISELGSPTEPLVLELQALLAQDYGGPLDGAGKKQLKAIEASLHGFEQAPASTWGDLRALTRAIRRLSYAFGADLAIAPKTLNLKALVSEVMDDLDAELSAAEDELRYAAPTLTPAPLARAVVRRTARAAKVLAAAHATEDLIPRSRRLTRVARMVAAATALADHSQGAADHCVFGAAFEQPVVADAFSAVYEQQGQRLWLRGWTVGSVPGYGGAVNLTVRMGGVTGPGYYPFGGGDWAAYVEVSGPDGIVRYDAPELTGGLMVELLDFETAQVKASFSFPAWAPLGVASLAVDHGSLHLAPIEMLP